MQIPNIAAYFHFFDPSAEGLNAYVLWLFTVSVGVYTHYYLVFFSRLLFYKSKTKGVEPYPVSVIIASRDDAIMLKKHLPLIMNQQDIEYEVIVVDDCSLDDTPDVIREYEESFKNFRHTKLVESGEFEGGKKYAITLGIKAAKYEHLVFIDADCYPNSPHWLRSMAEELMYKKVVAGYGPYEKHKGLLNKLIRYDAFKIAQQYLSFTISGVPYMAVGRNMGYHSHLYFESKGFTQHLNVVSGDDDLFVNEVANSKNTGVLIDESTFVYSVPKKTYPLWEFQKRRHLTTASRYKLKHQFLLALLPLAQYLMWGGAIYLLYSRYALEVIAVIIGLKFFIQAVIMGGNMHKLKVFDLYLWSIVLEPMLMLFYLWVSFLNIVKGDQRKRWI